MIKERGINQKAHITWRKGRVYEKDKVIPWRSYNGQNEHNFHSYRMWDTSWRIIRRVGRRAVVGHFGRMDQVWYGKRSVYRKDCSSARGVGRGKIKASNLRRMGL